MHPAACLPPPCQRTTHLFNFRVGTAVEHDPRQRAAGAQAVGRRAGGDVVALDGLVLHVVPCQSAPQARGRRGGVVSQLTRVNDSRMSGRSRTCALITSRKIMLEKYAMQRSGRGLHSYGGERC